MPFGLMNALVMFQHLTGTCLGDPQFRWCIIYLDDIIIFAATPKDIGEASTSGLMITISWTEVATH